MVQLHCQEFATLGIRAAFVIQDQNLGVKGKSLQQEQPVKSDLTYPAARLPPLSKITPEDHP